MTKRTTSEIQARSPHGREHLGPQQESHQPARLWSRPARSEEVAQAFRLRHAASRQAEAEGLLRNITERQFRGYYKEASRKTGDTGEQMIGLLERRLDLVVFRAKFVPTPFAARQIVNHGHVSVNGKRVNIASYLVKEGDVIELRGKAKDLALVLEAAKSSEREVPDYIDADHGKMSAKFVRVPKLAEVPYAVQMQPSLVVEFYSR
jgi:small subunit ribosomal protein S4